MNSMDYADMLEGIAETAGATHALLSSARARVQQRVAGGGVTLDAEARLVAKLEDAVCALGSVFVQAHIAADEHWRLAQADEN